MANRIKMAEANAIIVLWRRGYSFRRIARELGIHRETASRYVRLEGARSKPAKVILGAGAGDEAKPAKAILGDAGRRSECEPFREVILRKLDLELSAQRIWQDLSAEHGFTASYSSVRRFVRRLGQVRPLPFRRMECAPGEEAQVDFGRGAPVDAGDGRRRFPHVFRVVLSHSRKAYSEVVWRQTTESFIRCLENAFQHFTGIPKTLIIDNLRAAVKKADWYDPELNPKVEAFCRHYDTVILPARPYTPRHKGKVERGIAYVRSNALAGRVFASLSQENLHLAQWEKQVADHRIHGTTRRQVRELFEERERSTLLPLPPLRFPFFHEGQRSVHRDGHVEVDKAYYSVPPEYVARTVWVRWDAHLVRVFNRRFEQIAVHARKEQGRFSTQGEHIASAKISCVERGAGWLLKRAWIIGPQAGQWARAMLDARGIRGVRVLQGLLSLAEKHHCREIERACEAALSHGAYRLRAVRELITNDTTQEEFDFIEEHPLIRSMSDYQSLVEVSFRPEPEDAERETSIPNTQEGA